MISIYNRDKGIKLKTLSVEKIIASNSNLLSSPSVQPTLRNKVISMKNVSHPSRGGKGIISIEVKLDECS